MEKTGGRGRTAFGRGDPQRVENQTINATPAANTAATTDNRRLVCSCALRNRPSSTARRAPHWAGSRRSCTSRGSAGRILRPTAASFSICFFKPASADALAHPAFQVGLGGFPQVQVRVQFAAQPFHVQQGFLQQDQLRLDFHVEAARGLEQAQQHLPQRDLRQRPIEIRFADGAHRAFQFFFARVRRHPARFDMQLGHAPVIATEEGQEVLRRGSSCRIPTASRRYRNPARCSGPVCRPGRTRRCCPDACRRGRTRR